MTIQDMKDRTKLYDQLDNVQAGLNRDYLVRPTPDLTPLQARVQALVTSIEQLKTDLDNGVIG
jgi:hypothetical protein